jgi:shikimate kinase
MSGELELVIERVREVAGVVEHLEVLLTEGRCFEALELSQDLFAQARLVEHELFRHANHRGTSR